MPITASPFQTAEVNLPDNESLREPQREGWLKLRQHLAERADEREVGIVLPVGCGKSGLITIAPYASQATRVLVIAPGLRIKDQLAQDFTSANDANFYAKCNVIPAGGRYPEVATVEGKRTNLDDLQHAHVVVSNIHQLQGEENRWLSQLPADFFDLILMDEGHHNTADSWQRLREHFPDARIVNFSATPRRADGQHMVGPIIYSYPVVQAIAAGYVKRLRAKMLNSAQLRYLDPSDGQERLITADEVRKLGEEEATFRRGILMSDETLNAIVDCSINELMRLRKETGEQRLKIIASALNQKHCIQIVKAFRARNLKADFVHSLEGQEANRKVFAALKNHEIDVIVQARMLAEGFDHPFLAVAMVGSVFANLSPFVQFVGRVMRAIRSGEPGHALNQGVVVFHAGANAAARWDDFREFSDADQAYFGELLPLEEEVDFAGQDVITHEPGLGSGRPAPVEVLDAGAVTVQDLELTEDEEISAALDILQSRGVTPEQAQAALQLRRRQPQRQDSRRALRETLPDAVNNGVGQLMAEKSINARGKTIDPSRRQSNQEHLLSSVNRKLAERVGRPLADRHNYTLEELEICYKALPEILAEIGTEVGHGPA